MVSLQDSATTVTADIIDADLDSTSVPQLHGTVAHVRLCLCVMPWTWLVSCVE